MTRERADIRRILALRRYVSLKSFETETPAGRASERYRRAAMTAIAGGFARAVSLLCMLLSVPLALGYLGAERYGIVITLTALAAMLVFADFGLGSGLMNRVATARASGREADVRRSISSAFYILLLVAAAMGTAFAVVQPTVEWAPLLNVDERYGAEVRAAVAMFLVCVVLNLPFGMIQRVQFALQEGYITNWWGAVGSIAALLGLVVVIQLEATMSWIVLMLVGGPLAANVLNSLAFFGLSRRDLLPRWSAVNVGEAIAIAKLGALFFVLQLTVAVAYQADVVVATVVIGPQAATDYSVTHRLFMIVPLMLSMLILPMWPAYADAIARDDRAWVRRTVRLSSIGSFALTAAVSVVLIIAGPAIIHMWVGNGAKTTTPLLTGMAFWAVLNATFTAIAMLFNGAAVMRFQILSALAMGIASVVASVLLAQRIGVAGVIWGTVVAHIAFSAIPSLMYLPRLLRRLEERTPAHASAQQSMREGSDR